MLYELIPTMPELRLLQRLAQRQMLGLGGGREARRVGRHEGEGEVRVAAV